MGVRGDRGAGMGVEEWKRGREGERERERERGKKRKIDESVFEALRRNRRGG